MQTKGDHIIQEMKVCLSTLVSLRIYLRQLKLKYDDIQQDDAQLRVLFDNSLTSLERLGTHFDKLELHDFISKKDIKLAIQEAEERLLSENEKQESSENAITSEANQKVLSKESKMIKFSGELKISQCFIQSQNIVYVPSINSLAIAGDNGSLEVHEVESKLRTKKFQAHNCMIMVLRYIAETDILLSAAQDGRIYAWDVKNDFQKLTSFKRHKGLVYAMDYVPDLKLVVSGGKDGHLRMWQIGAKKADHKIKIKGESVNCICVLKQSGKIIVGDNEGVITGVNVNLKIPKVCFMIKGHVYDIVTLRVFQNEDYLISGGKSGALKIWRSVENGLECLRRMEDKDSKPVDAMVRSVQVFAERDLVISNHDDFKLRFWKLSTGELLDSFENETVVEAMVSLVRPNVFVTAMRKKVNVWELREEFEKWLI